MEVIYKKRIMDKIAEESRIAGQQGRVIEKIVLTDEEWQQLDREINFIDRLYLRGEILNRKPQRFYIYGIAVVHEKEAEND